MRVLGFVFVVPAVLSGSSNLQDDLEMSDSDDDQEPPFRKTSSLGFSISKNPTSPNENILQPPSLVEKMSSSDSSSSDSDDSSSASGSGSDSESSDSDGSAPETGREPSTQSWQLADLIGKRSSSVDEDSFTPILSQFPNAHADIDVMLKSPSPEGLDLIRSPVTKPSSFLLSPVHSSPSRSPLPLTSNARAAPHSPSPQGLQPAKPLTGVTAALSGRRRSLPDAERQDNHEAGQAAATTAQVRTRTPSCQTARASETVMAVQGCKERD
ncbi:hypothetical protein MRX96_022746 [Rhipicephalus microplus]